MFYKVYSDAATNVQEGYCCVAFLVIKGNSLLYSECEFINDISNPAHAESIALGKAIKYMSMLNLEISDKIVFYLDSLYTFKYANKRLKSIKRNNSNLCFLDKKANWLSDIYNFLPNINNKVSFYKVTSHTGIISPHSYVDRLVKLGLKFNNVK